MLVLIMLMSRTAASSVWRSCKSCITPPVPKVMFKYWLNGSKVKVEWVLFFFQLFTFLLKIWHCKTFPFSNCYVWLFVWPESWHDEVFISAHMPTITRLCALFIYIFCRQKRRTRNVPQWSIPLIYTRRFRENSGKNISPSIVRPSTWSIGLVLLLKKFCKKYTLIIIVKCCHFIVLEYHGLRYMSNCEVHSDKANLIHVGSVRVEQIQGRAVRLRWIVTPYLYFNHCEIE